MRPPLCRWTGGGGRTPRFPRWTSSASGPQVSPAGPRLKQLRIIRAPEPAGGAAFSRCLDLRARSSPWPSGPGVSSTTGRPSKRGSDRNTAQPFVAELALADGRRGGRGWSPAPSCESLRCSEPRRSSPTTSSHSSSTVRQALRGADVVARRVAGGRSPGRRRGARRRRPRRSARPARSNERPERAARAGGVLEVQRAALGLGQRLLDHLARALDRRRRPRRSCAEPGCSTTATAPSASPARSEAVSDVSVFSRISGSSEAAVEQVDGVDEQRVDVGGRHRLVVGGDLLVAVDRGLPRPAGSG